MRIERRISAREADLAERKAAALEAAKARYPEAEVHIHAYYGGDFYASVKQPGERIARVGVVE